MLLPVLFPQSPESLADPYHWYWRFSGVCDLAFLCFAFPLSCFMSYALGAGLCLFGLPIGSGLFIPLCVLLALNSLLVGYVSGAALSKLWARAKVCRDVARARRLCRQGLRFQA